MKIKMTVTMEGGLLRDWEYSSADFIKDELMARHELSLPINVGRDVTIEQVEILERHNGEVEPSE